MAPALILIRQNTNRTRQIVARKRSFRLAIVIVFTTIEKTILSYRLRLLIYLLNINDMYILFATTDTVKNCMILLLKSKMKN
jgi:hypothetical protein